MAELGADGIDEGSLQELREHVWGNVLLPGDPGYKAATKVWSVSPFRDPAAVPAVLFARRHGLPLAVRSGGHGAGNPTLVAGGVMVDMSLMCSATVDAKSRTVVADGGCLLGDIDRETSVRKLAVPLGHAPVTGFGLMASGGYGVTSRFFGPTCSNILEVQMVLADGSAITVNEESDPELAWATRGAASTLGVVTKAKFRLHDVSSAYTGRMLWVDDPQHGTYRVLMRWIRDHGSRNPQLAMNLARMIHPEKGPLLISQVVYLGPESEEAKAAFLQPLRDLNPLEDSVGQWTYLQTQSAFLPGLRALDAAVPDKREYWTGGYICTADDLTEEVIDELVRLLLDGVPPECPLSVCMFEPLGGALDSSDAPFGYTGAAFGWLCMVGWPSQQADEVGVSYARRIKKSMARYSKTDTYTNFTDASKGSGEVPAEEAASRVGGTANLERIRAVKQAYDPDNLFSCTPFAKLLASSAGQR